MKKCCNRTMWLPLHWDLLCFILKNASLMELVILFLKYCFFNVLNKSIENVTFDQKISYPTNDMPFYLKNFLPSVGPYCRAIKHIIFIPFFFKVKWDVIVISWIFIKLECFWQYEWSFYSRQNGERTGTKRKWKQCQSQTWILRKRRWRWQRHCVRHWQLQTEFPPGVCECERIRWSV